MTLLLVWIAYLGFVVLAFISISNAPTLVIGGCVRNLLSGLICFLFFWSFYDFSFLL